MAYNGKGVGGRPRKPRSLKILEGDFRPDRDKTQKVKPNGAPRCPQGLDATARSHWKHLVETRGEWLSKSDGPAMRLLCELWSHLRLADAEFRGDITDAKARNTYLTIEARWVQLAGKFGLSPVDREQLGVVKGDSTNARLTEKYLA